MLQFLLKLVNRLLWSAISIVLVSMAILVSLGRYYMPQLGHYQDDILVQLRERIDLQFEMESLEGEWRGLSPVVRVKNFRLFNSGGEAVIEADHLAIYFDLLETIYRRTPLAQTVSLADADISLSRGQNGAWGLKGIDREGGSSRVGAVAAAFIEQIDLLELNHVRINTWLPDQTRQSIESLSLVLRQGLDLSQLTLELSDPRGKPSLRLAAEFEGWLDRPASFRGYLSLDKLDLQLVEPYLAQWYPKLPPQLSGEAWLDWHKGSGWEGRGTLITSDWQLRHLLEREVPDLEELDFDFLFSLGSEGELEGRIQDLGFNWTGVDFRFPQIELSVDDARQDLGLRFSVASIEPIVRAASNSKLLPTKLAEVFATLQPRGKLRHIHMDIPLQKDRLSEFQLRAKVVGAALQSWKGAPGASSIDGYVEAGLKHGHVDLDGSYLQLEFPGLYQTPLDFDTINARVGWRVGERVLVNSGLIEVEGDFGQGRAQLDLDIPLVRAEGDYAHMSLMIGLRDSDARYRMRYIPQILSKPLLSWLDVSVKAAEVEQLGFIYFGALTSVNPLDKTVQLFLDARNGRLRYQPEWPELEQVDAQLVLSDDYLLATSPKVKTLDSTVSDVRVELSRREQQSWLDITGELQGPAGDLIRLLNESPLRQTTGGAFEHWHARGEYGARLDLDIPMQSTLAPRLAVDGTLKGVSLANRGLDIEFTELKGDMQYRSTDGIRAKRLRGKLWGETLVASVGPGRETDMGNIPLLLNAQGEVEVESLRQWLDNPAVGLARGKTRVDAEMTIAPAGDTTLDSTLKLRSELVGVELALPEPFAKVAQEPRFAELEINLRKIGYGELRYAGLAGGRFHLGGEQPRAGIWLGSRLVPELPEAGTVVSGVLQQVDLEQWLDTLERFRELAGQAATTPQNLLSVNQLTIGSLHAFGQQLEHPVLNIGVVEDRWQVAVKHPRIQGSIDLPDDDDAFVIDLEYLRMPLSETAPTASGGDGLAAVNPAELPAAEVKLEEFRIGDLDMGRWQFDLSPTGRGAAVRSLTVVVNGVIFGGVDISEGAALDWGYEGQVHRSSLRGMLRAGNLDDLFSHWGYDAGVVSESAEVFAGLQWDGAPDAISLESIYGDISLTVRDGQLQQTSGTAAEALKVVSILNINNLARRLRLDFSDLYKKGLSYDKIQGILLFDRGKLTMDEPLEVKGPSSRVKMTGDFYLDERSAIDAEMVVTLPITSNLPWVVALTLPGGIPLAAGVFVAGKVFEKQLQKLTSAVYSVKGTLDDPVIEFKRLTDVAKKKSAEGASTPAESAHENVP